MAEVTHAFDDAEAYELFMGRWSRAAGAIFLDWLAPPKNARWLDVGCGTGVFTKLVLDTCSPAAIAAVDPSPEQIEHARSQQIVKGADFRVADAQTLPFPDSTFDVVASALVINFIPDRSKALAEMRRVAHAGGIVGGYVWDFAAGHSPSSPIRDGMVRIGLDPPQASGTSASTLAALKALFEQAGFADIATRTIDVTGAFDTFDDFWRSQTPSYGPVTKLIAALPETERARLIATVRSGLKPGADGSIAYSARANAVKARVPT